MRIAILGCYNSSNEGDDRIGFCLKKFFEGKGDFVDLYNIQEGLKVLSSDEKSYDHVIYGGGGLITRGMDNYVKSFSRISQKITCLGISVESVSNSRAFIDFLLEKSLLITVRDKKSKELLKNHHKVIASKDVTFLYPFDIVDFDQGDVCAFNIRYWPYWRKYAEFNSKLDLGFKAADFYLPLVSRFFEYKQDSIFKNIFKELSNKFSSVIPLPFLYRKFNKHATFSYPNDVDLLGKYFSNVDGEKFNISYMSKANYIIAMRLHAIIFSMQLGIPFLNLVYQPKNINLLEDVNLSELGIDFYCSKVQLGEKIEYLKRNRDQIREKILHYRGMAHKQIWGDLEKAYQIIINSDKSK